MKDRILRGMLRLPRALVIGALLASAAPAAADMGFYGWGPRIGVGDDPDQIIVGLHQDFGEFIERVRFQPNLELGLGDDYTILSVTIPVHYRFKVASGATPYLGGGLLIAYIDRDLTEGQKRRGVDDSELDLAPVLVGGVEWSVGSRSDLLLELHAAGGDAHDAKVIFGWILRAR